MRTEVRIAGFGGQGVIMAGVIIGKAASLFDNKNAVQTQSYGPEARGGASRTEVVIDDDEIDYPKVTSPDILVAMSHEALIKYMGDLKDEGVLIIDPDMIVEEEIVYISWLFGSVDVCFYGTYDVGLAGARFFRGKSGGSRVGAIAFYHNYYGD